MTLAINEIHEGDCLELMQQIPDKSVDMILCDLPYGTTACKWDELIPFPSLWKEYERVISDNGAIVLFGIEPFSSHMRVSNIKLFKYDWYWEKSIGTNFAQAPNMPLKACEIISVFSKAPIGHVTRLGEKRMLYNPQGTTEATRTSVVGESKRNTEHKYHRKSHAEVYKHKAANYPRQVIKFANAAKTDRGLHPTQKPVALFEYLIKTYTNEGGVILDNCIGSGTTAIAAINTNRQYIGIEMDAGYVEIARNRIKETRGALV